MFMGRVHYEGLHACKERRSAHFRFSGSDWRELFALQFFCENIAMEDIGPGAEGIHPIKGRHGTTAPGKKHTSNQPAIEMPVQEGIH